jgi:hypothetical protein
MAAKKASECGTEVASRHVLSGKIAGDFLAYFLSSEDLCEHGRCRDKDGRGCVECGSGGHRQT